MSLSGGAWLGSMDLDPQLLMTGFLRFGGNNFEPLSKLVGKNVLFN